MSIEHAFRKSQAIIKKCVPTSEESNFPVQLGSKDSKRKEKRGCVDQTASFDFYTLLL